MWSPIRASKYLTPGGYSAGGRGGWRLEKREGDADHHYRALPTSKDPSQDGSTLDPVLRELFNLLRKQWGLS